MNKKILAKIEDQIDLTFNDSEIASMAFDFIEFQAEDRGLSFGELTIFHYKMFNGQNVDIYSVAAAIEILVLATDILDDLQDQDNLSTPWQAYDQPVILNLISGLFLLSKKVLDASSLSNLSTVSDAYYSMIFQSMTSQHIDIRNQIKNERDYLDIVLKKSSSLVTLACLLGAISANANDQQQGVVKSYSHKLGIISQLKNDISDVLTWDKKSDLLLKKKTHPILYMLGINEPSIIKAYYLSDDSYDKIKKKGREVIEEMTQLGAFRYTKIIIELNIIEALEQIKSLEVSQLYKDLLKKVFEGGMNDARNSSVLK